ncbi:MAG: glycosyltransferase [Candidatus Hydrogenedentes bacterium]|nr:glycosyltransferase [Candidatus Hydrogenedentota bacterium]
MTQLDIQPDDDSMLLVLPVPVRICDGVVLFEAQACNGVERWADNFASLVIAVPVIPESLVQADGSSAWVDVSALPCRDRVEFVPLPWAYRWATFLKTYSRTRRTLGDCIARCRYLQFAFYGLAGDWASVAAREAMWQGRSYAVHTDNVAHEFSVRSAAGHGRLRRLRARIEAPVMQRYHRGIVRRCTLGLWHGYDCYQAYSPYCANSHNIHDVHTKPEDAISEAEYADKALHALHDPALRVCYVGRVTGIKAPLDWVRALAHARDRGAALRAKWLGDGPLLEEMRALARELGLGESLDTPGFVSDRAAVLAALRDAHLLLFTHLTPESPRCLLEALISGTPIAGYGNAFATDLVQGHGGGVFVSTGDWRALGDALVQLAADRARLSNLIAEAGANGRRFNDATVFRERSELIKRYLP